MLKILAFLCINTVLGLEGLCASPEPQGCRRQTEDAQVLIQTNLVSQGHQLDNHTWKLDEIDETSPKHGGKDERAPADVFKGLGSTDRALRKLAKAHDSGLPHHSMSSLGRVTQLLPVLVIVWMSVSKVQQMYASEERPSAAEVTEVMVAIALFMISGPAIILVNKHIIRHYNFHFPVLLASMGQVFLMFVTRGAVAVGLHRLETTSVDWGQYWKVVAPVNALNFLSQVLGMWCYLFISVPEIQILKSITIVMVLVFAYLLLNEPVTWKLAAGVMIIAMGTCLSAAFEAPNGSQSGSSTRNALFGVFLAILANACEAGKTVTCQALMCKLNVFDGLYWSTPLFSLFACISVGAIELRRLIQFDFSWELCGIMAANTVLTSIIVLSSFWVVKLTGALTLKVLTQARTIGLILCSVFFFSETCSPMQYVGFAISLVGMVIFDQAKCGTPSGKK